MKIVLVEDELAARSGICNMLMQRTPHEVCGVAMNGEQGYALIREKKPDLVITDIRMPKMSGLEMMRALKREGCGAQFIILSGYSDFQYAQEAMRLGAVDYLLKPATPEMLTDSIAQAETRCSAKAEYTPKPEYWLEQLLDGSDDASTALQQLTWLWRISPQHPCALVLLHLNNCRQKDVSYTLFAEAVQAAADELCLEAMRIAPLSPKLGILCVVGECDKMPKLESMLARYFLPGLQEKHDCTAAYVKIDSLQELAAGVERLQERLLAGTAGERQLMDADAQPAEGGPFQYPAALENTIKMALFRGDSKAFLTHVEHFVQVILQSGGTHVEHKDAMLRFWSMVGLQMQEFYGEGSRSAFANHNLHRILDAATVKELTDTCRSIEDEVCMFLRANETKAACSKLVGSAVRYIEEHYKELLDQKEIASLCRVTPEYLSAQFTKEMGTSFSSYVRKYRIRQAKYFLVNTDIKIQQIGTEVGYAEPAYFNRVFHTECGMSPTEYRKLFKAEEL